MEITASMVKELRDITGAGMMDCKSCKNTEDKSQQLKSPLGLNQLKNIRYNFHFHLPELSLTDHSATWHYTESHQSRTDIQLFASLSLNCRACR